MEMSLQVILQSAIAVAIPLGITWATFLHRQLNRIEEQLGTLNVTCASMTEHVRALEGRINRLERVLDK